jgi:hypothetical protein
VVQIDIPCGRRGAYLDPTTSYIRFKATYTAGSMVANTDAARLMGSAYSYFIKQEVYGNNSVVLESINEVGVLASMLMNLQLNDSDKRGLSPSMGFEGGVAVTGLATANPLLAYSSSATAGHCIAADAVLQNLVFEYSMPLIGILGSGTDKMIPIGAIYGLRLELTMDNYANFTKLFVGTAGHIMGDCSITEFEFVANVIELGPEAQALIEQANPEKIHIRSNTYRQASSSLPASTAAGTNDMLVGIRVSSLKSIFLACSPSDAAEGKFAGVNPNLDQGTCFIIAGQSFPQRTINPSGHPSDTYEETQKSLGALTFSAFNGCISKAAYNRGSVGSSTYAGSQCLVYNSTAANIMLSPNQFYLGVDTEVVARKSSLLSGINVNSSPMFFRAQIGYGIAAVTHQCNFFGNYDVILEVDTQLKNIIAKF